MPYIIHHRVITCRIINLIIRDLIAQWNRLGAPITIETVLPNFIILIGWYHIGSRALIPNAELVSILKKYSIKSSRIGPRLCRTSSEVIFWTALFIIRRLFLKRFDGHKTMLPKNWISFLATFMIHK